jgi:hypothetical protein
LKAIYENFEKRTFVGHLISKTKSKPKPCSLEKLKNNLRKLPIAMLSTTKCDQRDEFILGANNTHGGGVKILLFLGESKLPFGVSIPFSSSRDFQPWSPCSEPS